MTKPTQVTSALLALWIFVLSLAGVSPALHSWLHADSSCAHTCETHTDEAPEDAEGHYCGVIALQGTLHTLALIDLPERTSFERIDFKPFYQLATQQRVDQPFQARAPPIEILV